MRMPSIAPPGLPVAALLLCAALLPRPAWAEGLALLMVEAPGCVWCARWHAEVGDAYPLTPEGRAAPLQTIMLSDPDLGAYALDSRPVFTPTFILVEGTQERARIEGYPGEDFFWGLLGGLLDETDPDWAQAGPD